ncbi:MAG: sulfite exporter TauE/SafE family protein [Deltaproteobacteria bacterium]|nr:sulfite exporter TauE/SafE family protein [Deltaproteobacteria bacterium]
MYLTLFLIAALVSSIGTLAGFGGGIFIVPIMVMGFDVPIEIAIGVTAFALFPSSLLSTYWNFRKQTVDFKLMWALEIPTICGAIIGAHFTSIIPTRPLEIIFSLFLMILSYKIMKPSNTHHPFSKAVSFLNSREPILKKQDYKVSLWTASLFGGLSGIVAGLFGIGGGILKTPIMINIFKVPV